MHFHSRRGDSLVELIVALVILEVVGAAALAAGLTAEHFNRHAANGARDDASRWTQYRSAETAPACAAAALPDTQQLRFPATPDRPPLESIVRCGR